MDPCRGGVGPCDLSLSILFCIVMRPVFELFQKFVIQLLMLDGLLVEKAYGDNDGCNGNHGNNPRQNECDESMLCKEPNCCHQKGNTDSSPKSFGFKDLHVFFNLLFKKLIVK